VSNSSCQETVVAVMTAGTGFGAIESVTVLLTKSITIVVPGLQENDTVFDVGVVWA